MRDLKQIEVLAQKGSACGTTCLAMIIRFLLPGSGITPEDIDREIRRLPDMFSSPQDLIEYALKKGLRAEEYNESSISRIEEFVNQGIPIMALLDLTPANALDVSQWHWVVVVAIEGAGEQKTLVINNPWGRREEWPQDKFLKEWARLKLLGLVFGYNNYLIAVGTGGDAFPASRSQGTAAANAVTKGLADVLNGFARLRQNRNLGGIGQMLAGVLRMAYGSFRLIANNIGYAIKLVLKHQS